MTADKLTKKERPHDEEIFRRIERNVKKLTKTEIISKGRLKKMYKIILFPLNLVRRKIWNKVDHVKICKI